MPSVIHINNSSTTELETALENLRQIIVQRIDAHLNQHSFDTEKLGDEIFQKLQKQNISNRFPRLSNIDEWIIIMLAAVPHIQPGFFDSIMLEALPGGGDFPEFGGVKGTNHRGLLPTG